MKKIVYERPDGGISIVTPAEGARMVKSITMGENVFKPDGDVAARADTFFRRWPVEGATVEWAETEDEFLERIRNRDVPKDAVNPRFVDPADIPEDRTFRNAWKADLSVDMSRAREIHKDRLREDRRPLLESLDVDYQRADESGDDERKLAIAARKQMLRDVTKAKAIEAAQTPQELSKLSLACGLQAAACI